MVPFFTFGGYSTHDPLDRGKPSSGFPWKPLSLVMVVAFFVSLVFLSLVFNVLNVSTLSHAWLLWLECAVLALFYAPVLYFLRRSSSLVCMAPLVLVAIPLDIVIHETMRQVNLEGSLWYYNSDGPLGGLPPWLQILAVWVIDAFVCGVVVLWFSRLIASRFWKKAEDAETGPIHPAYNALFSDARSLEPREKPRRDFAFWGLRVIGLGYTAYLGLVVLAAFGRSVWPDPVRELLDQSYANPPLAINTFIKLACMVSLLFAGAYNRKLRFHTALVLLVAHGVSTICSLGFFLLSEVKPYHDFLLTSAIVDTVMMAFFAWVMLRFREHASEYGRDREFPVFYSVAHRLTHVFYIVFGIVLAVIVPTILAARVFLPGDQGWGAIYGFPDPQVCNTLTKYATLSLLAFLLAGREALREKLLGVIALAYATSVIASATWLLVIDLFSDVVIQTRGGGTTQESWYFMLNVAIDGIVLILILSLRRMFYVVEYSISALSPRAARNVVAVAEVLYPGDLKHQSTLLKDIDRHVAGLQGRKRGLLNFPFAVMESVLPIVYGLRPPLSVQSPEERRSFLRRRVLRPLAEQKRDMLPDLARLSYQLGVAVHGPVTLAYYNSASGRKKVGYVLPDARDRLQGQDPQKGTRPPYQDEATLPQEPKDPLNRPPPDDHASEVAPRVSTPSGREEIPDEVDYLIIGSGAGGATMAYHLAKGVDKPARIAIVERGKRLSPLQDFNEDELEMIRKLYKEGGLQQTRSMDLTILQGECVGGSTVMNNAICVTMPNQVRQIWENDFGLDLSSLDDDYKAIQDDLDIQEIPDYAINERVADVFNRGVGEANRSLEEPLRLRTLQVNAMHPQGRGTWNLGNFGLRKRSMLETYIPWSESRGVQVIDQASVVQILRGSRDGTADSVTLRTRIGDHHRVRVQKAVIIAAGAVASSHVLMRSGLRAYVGAHMSCNFAIPSIAQFNTELRAFDGIQISLAAEDPQARAIFETYFNPPGSYGISVPFFFQRHQGVMEAYQQSVNFGALVGSTPSGEVLLKPDILDGRAIAWSLKDEDRTKLTYAMTTLMAIAKGAGATKIILPTQPGLEIDLEQESLQKVASDLNAYPFTMRDLRLVTAHPQGGNRMAALNAKDGSSQVVDESFRVAGWNNVYVADASIFPTGITVNPQWTIMAMSRAASRKILEHTR